MDTRFDVEIMQFPDGTYRAWMDDTATGSGDTAYEAARNLFIALIEMEREIVQELERETTDVSK